MLCQSCLTTIKTALKRRKLILSQELTQFKSSQGRDHPYILHDSLHDLYLSVVEGCFICREVWEYMLEQVDYTTDDNNGSSEEDGNPTVHEDRLLGEFEILRKWRKSKNSSIHLTLSPWNDVLDLKLTPAQFPTLELSLWPIPATDTVLYTSKAPTDVRESLMASENPGLWSHWFRTCSESHETCRDLDNKLPPFAPDRLIEIASEDNGNSFTWRLVHPVNIGNVKYLTLSHCWGSSRHTSLTSKTYSDFQAPNSDFELPKTFRHAFTIAFSLGFRFIWIDSLCIIQDDPTDWKAQASMMGSVYKNARCNIAATWASDGSDGCFRTRRKFGQITLDLGPGRPKDYQIVPPLLYYNDIVEAPLNSRGWVAQERYLAGRQLSFAWSQVYWECRELIASEQFPAGIPRRLRNYLPYKQAAPPTGKPTLNFAWQPDRRAAWAALMEFYSTCSFSKLSDKLIALAGLAEEVRNATEDVYLAGLWKDDLERQLCWSTDNSVQGKADRFRMQTYLAPTWSWASVDAPVLSDIRYAEVDMKAPSCIEIVHVAVQSKHFSRLHSFVSSRLAVRGIAVWARAIPRDTPAEHSETDPVPWELQPTGLSNISDGNEIANIPVAISWDENMSNSDVNPERWNSFLEERNSDLLCLLVYLAETNVTGLLLRKLPSAAYEVPYVRMGIFVTRDGGGFIDFLSRRLRYPPGYNIEEDIDLDEAGIADLVHTVILV